eukprot:GEMP01020430.1.p1 GENE.GEMP01020430.1~~GEMP01020430.1.p1  ORF type:complete len:443 (+),score=69.60 GEMP01020430.1:169-1497(+)
MHIIYVVLLYAAVVSIGAAIFLYGRPDGNSIFDRLYRLFATHLPNIIKRILQLFCGARGPRALDSVWDYVVWQCNPIVQIFYVGILSGGYIGFVACAHPHLPSLYAPEYHKLTAFLMVMTSFLFWLTCSFSDPGTITRRNARALTKVYPFDKQIFHKGRCNTCKTVKPARSKHCGLCDVCVGRFDHHCIWINNCVGIGNHRLFLGFLMSNCMLTAYGATLCLLIVLGIMEEKKLTEATFFDPKTKEKFKATWSILLYYMVANESVIMFVAILCAVMSVVLFGFFMWHLHLVRTGVTSNELAKWRGLKEYLRELQSEDAKKFLESLNNIYNKGLFRNLMEIVCPINVHDYYSAADEESSEEEEEKEPNTEKRADAELAKEDGETSKKEKKKPDGGKKDDDADATSRSGGKQDKSCKQNKAPTQESPAEERRTTGGKKGARKRK